MERKNVQLIHDRDRVSLTRRGTGPRVFVAMPFGRKRVDNSEAVSTTDIDGVQQEVDFDDIWRLLLKPALENAGCRPFRADDEPSAGDIRTDMFFELVTGEFVLADISTLNANVFYELGVRHGVSPRGVLMIDGGWGRRPFDVAPDRTFAYTGALFQTPESRRDTDWASALKQQISVLAERLHAAMNSDASTTSSPVYKELPGLKPVDWSGIRNAKARYFGGQLNDWHSRVRKAKRQSYVGDILTLSRDAPNQLIEWELRVDAARALFDLGSFERARELLRFTVQENPENAAARYALAKTLDRLARQKPNDQMAPEYQARAEVEIEEAVRRGGDDPEAHSLLGRIYKYRWRFHWGNCEIDLTKRRQLGAKHWEIAEKSLRHYQHAQTLNLRLFHAGVNIISLQRLHTFLHDQALSNAAGMDEDLIGLVRIAARAALERGKRVTATDDEHGMAIWAKATLGETALLLGEAESAVDAYRTAANDPEVSVSQLKSFDDQLAMYDDLGFEIDAVRRVRSVLQERLNEERSKRFRAGCFEPAGEQHRSVIAFRGAAFDAVDLEDKVREQLERQLNRWNVGAGDVVVCGARRGSEIMFASQCVSRGASVRLLLPLKRSEFVSESVRTRRPEWEERFHKLLEHCEVLEQPMRLGPTPVHVDHYDRNNLWCLDLARTELGPEFRPRVAVLLIDGAHEDASDQRGGVVHFVQHAQQLDLLVEEIVVRTESATETARFPIADATAIVEEVDGRMHRRSFAGMLSVGRAEGNDVILSDERVSRRHLKLEPCADGLHLNNLSRHRSATFLDGLELDPGGVVWMAYGQTIKLVDGTRISVENAAQGPAY